jgi:hypothetical protein
MFFTHILKRHLPRHFTSCPSFVKIQAQTVLSCYMFLPLPSSYFIIKPQIKMAKFKAIYGHASNMSLQKVLFVVLI